MVPVSTTAAEDECELKRQAATSLAEGVKASFMAVSAKREALVRTSVISSPPSMNTRLGDRSRVVF
jgi:hypothetical protein